MLNKVKHFQKNLKKNKFNFTGILKKKSNYKKKLQTSMNIKPSTPKL